VCDLRLINLIIILFGFVSLSFVGDIFTSILYQDDVEICPSTLPSNSAVFVGIYWYPYELSDLCSHAVA